MPSCSARCTVQPAASSNSITIAARSCPARPLSVASRNTWVARSPAGRGAFTVCAKSCMSSRSLRMVRTWARSPEKLRWMMVGSVALHHEALAPTCLDDFDKHFRVGPAFGAQHQGFGRRQAVDSYHKLVDQLNYAARTTASNVGHLSRPWPEILAGWRRRTCGRRRP